MKKLKQWVIDMANTISTKYRFRSTFELEQEDMYDFCDAFIQAIQLGLVVDEEDEKFIFGLRDHLSEDQ